MRKEDVLKKVKEPSWSTEGVTQKTMSQETKKE